MYGLSPVWLLSCFILLPKSENFRSQYRHPYGLTPVWVLKKKFDNFGKHYRSFSHLICRFSSKRITKQRSQNSHLYGLSPRCLANQTIISETSQNINFLPSHMNLQRVSIFVAVSTDFTSMNFLMISPQTFFNLIFLRSGCFSFCAFSLLLGLLRFRFN